jgi:hypothetical protein
MKEEITVTTPELLRKLEIILNDAERSRLFGTIEIEVRDGRPAVLRTLKTEKLNGETPRDFKQNTR